MRFRRLLLACAALALVAVAGCNRIFGVDDFHLAEDAGVDAGSTTVTGTSVLTYLWPGGTQDVAEDLSKYTIAAYIPDPAEPSGFRVIPGTGTVDGKLTIEGVPAGTYYLKLVAPGETAPTFYVTDDRVLDLGHSLAGRPDALNVGDHAPVTFNIGVPKEGASSQLPIEEAAYSFSAGAFFDLSKIPNSERDWTDPSKLLATTDWTRSHSMTGGSARSVREGDDFYLVRYGGRGVDGNPLLGGRYVFYWISQLYESQRVSISSKEPADVSGQFRGFSLNDKPTVRVSVDVAQFERMIFDRGSAFERVYETSRVATPIAPQFSVPLSVDEFQPDRRFITTFTPRLVRIMGIPLWHLGMQVRRAELPGIAELPRMRYPEVLPATWQQHIVESFTKSRWIQHPAAPFPAPLVSFVRSTREPSGSGVFRSPIIGTPKDILIDGADAMEGGRVAFDGKRVLHVSWAAAAGAAWYEVQVVNIYATGDYAALRTVVSIVTERTTADIPAEGIPPGDFYAISVTAIADAAAYGAGSLRTFSASRGEGRLFTGMFRFSTLCGNGAVDPGEDCDGGDSCDVDCTKVECRDGLKGGAEQCDDGLRSSGRCDDCKLTACDDTRYSPNAEDCDDSAPGSTPGRGCSASCAREGRCGDGIVQPAFELCDDGNDSEFDSCVFCHPFSCGDGFVSSEDPAREQCDDANDVGGDGCSASCLREQL